MQVKSVEAQMSSRWRGMVVRTGVPAQDSAYALVTGSHVSSLTCPFGFFGARMNGNSFPTNPRRLEFFLSSIIIEGLLDKSAGWGSWFIAGLLYPRLRGRWIFMMQEIDSSHVV
ncbi:hypothetical protein TNCV_5003621 [Trichonephila clavipes]|nr:hypothetical protein TNCV_5003621 [Trichonephila clavipes]